MLGAQAPSPYLSARTGTRPPPPPESDSAKAAEEINRWLGVAEGIVTSPVTDLIIQGGLAAGRGGKQEGKWEGTPEQRVARQRAAVGAREVMAGAQQRHAQAQAEWAAKPANPFARGSDRDIMRRRAMDALNWLRGTDGPEPGESDRGRGVGDPGGALKAATAAAARRLGGMDPPADARDPHRPPEQAERPGAGTFSRDAMLQTAWEQYHKTRQGPQPLTPSPYRASYWSQMPSDADEIFYIAHQGGSTNDLKRIMRALEAAPDLGPRNLSDLLAGTNDRLLGAKREALLAFMARNKQMSSTGEMESSRAMAEIYEKVMKGRKAGVEAKKIEDREARRGQGGGKPPPARKPYDDAAIRAFFTAMQVPAAKRTAADLKIIADGKAGWLDAAYEKLTPAERKALVTNKSLIDPLTVEGAKSDSAMALQKVKDAAKMALQKVKDVAAAARESEKVKSANNLQTRREQAAERLVALRKALGADEDQAGQANNKARTLLGKANALNRIINQMSLNGQDYSAKQRELDSALSQMDDLLRGGSFGGYAR